MSHRLAQGATAEQRFQLGGLRRRQRRFAKGENIGPRPAGHVTQQDFAIPRGLSLWLRRTMACVSHC